MTTVKSIQRINHSSGRTHGNLIFTDQFAAAIDACLIKEPRKRLSSLDPIIKDLQDMVFDYGFATKKRKSTTTLPDTVPPSPVFWRNG